VKKEERRRVLSLYFTFALSGNPTGPKKRAARLTFAKRPTAANAHTNRTRNRFDHEFHV